MHLPTLQNTDNTQNQEQLDPELKAKVQQVISTFIKLTPHNTRANNFTVWCSVGLIDRHRFYATNLYFLLRCYHVKQYSMIPDGFIPNNIYYTFMF